MNYRHIYHAGNLCDVFKHIVLVQLLERLHEKAPPLFHLDTHAGIGLYALDSVEATKTSEASDGIKKIATAQHPMFGRYFTLLRRANALFPAINICPGSPWLMAQLLRPHDKLVLCEKHPDDFLLLKKNMPAWPNIQLHHRDAYEAMGALLPPHEPRGFVLIDPPFEQADEWQKIHAALQKSAKKFSHAVCALWYPIKDRTTTQRHVETIANMGWKKIMLAEFIYAPPQRSDRLNGCGMLLINAPWQLDQWLTALIPALHQALQQPNCGSLVEVMGES